MGLQRPDHVDTNGDESVLSPRNSDHSLLISERGSNKTRRLESDASGNLQVNIADNATQPLVNTLASGSQVNVPDNVLTTIVTYTAAADRRVTKISCSGSIYAKFQLFYNTVCIETLRTGPDRNVVFVFNAPLNAPNGTILDVKVTHYATGDTGDFETTIYGA